MTYHSMMIDFGIGNERECNNTHRYIDYQYTTEDSAALEAKRGDFECK